MKQDKLEKFILENREEFDDLVPDLKIWDKIQDNIEPARVIPWRDYLWKAAAVLVIFTASYFFHDFIGKNKTDNPTESTLAGIPGQEEEESIEMLLEAEAYYSAQINNRKQEVFRLAGDNPQLINDINVEFEELDQVLQELRNDLKDLTATEEIIEAMIQNYRLKLNILEEMLYQLKAAKGPDQRNENYQEHEI